MVVPWGVPLMQAPVGPATTLELACAVSGVGALGTVAASWAEPASLRTQVRDIRAVVGSRFCVNLVLAFDQRERLKVVVEEAVGFVSFSWGIDAGLIEQAHAAGVVVLVQVGDIAGGLEAAAAGADLVIAQGIEAGGHVQGTMPLVELLDGLRPLLDLPIIAAGGIADSGSARAALDAGADGVACGTAFLAAREADVHPAYLDRLLHADAPDAVLTTAFDIGWPDAPHRVLRTTHWSGGKPSAAHPAERARARTTWLRPATAVRSSATATHSPPGQQTATSTRWRCTRARRSPASGARQAPPTSRKQSCATSVRGSRPPKRHSRTLGQAGVAI